MKASRSEPRSRVRKWSGGRRTNATRPPDRLFTRSAPVIARTLASKRVSPKGPASGLRMLTFYINCAGKNLTAERRRQLERAKTILSAIVRDAEKH